MVGLVDKHFMVLPVREVTKEITVDIKITGYKGWLIRLWIAKQFFRLGAWVANVGIEFKSEDGSSK